MIARRDCYGQQATSADAISPPSCTLSMYANAHENASAVTIHEVIEPAIAIAADGLPRHRVNFYLGQCGRQGFCCHLGGAAWLFFRNTTDQSEPLLPLVEGSVISNK
jgi:uncharacterized membrane protein YGL010W